MPVLPPPIKNLVTNARFTASDLATLRKAVQSGQANADDARAIATQYAETLEAGVGSWLRAFLQSLGGSTSVAIPIANLSSETALLNGQITLPDSGRKHPAVRSIQRALMAIASRNKTLEYMLPQFGADGDYGNETVQAVKNFQKNTSLPITGKVDATTAKEIDRVLRRAQPFGIMSATPTDLVRAAVELTTEPVAFNYGVEQPWINIDPSHAVFTDRPFDFLKGRWKCNLFGGNVLRKGGYEPPYYGNQGKGEYPNANQWYKWSDRYAAQHENKVHFQWIAELAPETMTDEEKAVAIADFLSKVQPGDFVMADHPGAGVQDGGHTRVAVSTNFAVDGTVAFAQAHFEQSVIEQEGADQLFWEEKIWLLRPNRKM
jgi:peptidoglycan hydrolase-like protein with peptidoglycan-binding domain